MSKYQVLSLAIVLIIGAVPALAGDVVYVDLSGIDTAFPGLTPEQLQQLKNLIVADIRANFSVAGVDIGVTTDPNVPHDRTVHINDDLGTHQRPDGTTGHHYGEWRRGSRDVNVHLDNFTDRHGADYQNADGTWDLDKLRKGIGRTAAHEVAHSYSVGHNSHNPPDKMTEGGLVSSSTRANTEWIFDQHTGEVIGQNLGKEPCASTTDYDEEYIDSVFTFAPLFPNPDWDPTDPNSDPFNDLDEFGNFDARLLIGGALALAFDFGWYGKDSDHGIEDGNPRFDFIYKASLAEPEPTDRLTFFADAHVGIQFALRGRHDTPWAGLWFPMSEALVNLDNPAFTPGGEVVFRRLDLHWDIDQDGAFDVFVSLDSHMLYPWGAEFNGWRIGRVWPCFGDLNHDYAVTIADLAQLLSNYGTRYGARFEDGDLDGDRDVDIADLAALLSVYGTTCPVLAPDFVIPAPFPPTFFNTCGAGDDCDAPGGPLNSEDLIFEVHIPHHAQWTFSLCGSLIDTWMAVGTTICGQEIGWNDDYCGLQSELTAVLPPGVYYVLVEGKDECGEILFAVHPAAPPQCIPPGDDCFFTQSGGAVYDFASDPISPDFFGPGSDPFDGIIAFEQAAADEHVVVTRHTEMCFMTPWPSAADALIELTQLELTAPQPILIHIAGEPTLWLARLGRSAVPAGTGVLTAVKDHPGGGVFSAHYPFFPAFIFTRLDNPQDVRVWDLGMMGHPPLTMQMAGLAHWSIEEPFEICTFDGFAAAQREISPGIYCCDPVRYQSFDGGFTHEMISPLCPPCPP